MSASTGRVSAHGKQLMIDGRHLADVRDERAAQAIALHLNMAVMIMPTEAEERILREGLGV